MNEQFANELNEKPRILIVDNSSQFARNARLLLDRSGKYVACTVIDPRRALETARSFKPDLVLVDLVMPEEDGPEVAAEFEADWALHGVPIVFFTSLITAEEAKDGRRVYGHRILRNRRATRSCSNSSRKTSLVAPRLKFSTEHPLV